LKDLVVKEKQAVNYPHRTRKITYSPEVHSLVGRALSFRGVKLRLLVEEVGVRISLIEKERRRQNPQRQFSELALTPHVAAGVHADSEKQSKQNSHTENFGKFEFSLPFGLRLLLEQKNKNRDVSIVLRTEG
jgi:hypothetical protein